MKKYIQLKSAGTKSIGFAGFAVRTLKQGLKQGGCRQRYETASLTSGLLSFMQFCWSVSSAAAGCSDQEACGFEQPQAVYKWLHGQSLPSIDNLLILAKLFESTVEGILATSGDALPHFYNKRETHRAEPDQHNDAIPEEWLSATKRREWIEEICELWIK